MQKNVPKYTPAWVRTVQLWAEASKRDVSYALCNDRRTLLWFANQRAIEYHPALVRVDRPDRDHPPRARPRPARSRCVRDGGSSRAAGAPGAGRCRPQGAVKTSGAKGVHVFVPIDDRGVARGLGRRDPRHRGAGRAARSRDRHDRVHQGRPWRQGVRRLDPGRRRHRDRGVQPARPSGRAGLVPGRLGRPRRHRAGRLHRAHRAPTARRPRSVGRAHARPAATAAPTSSRRATPSRSRECRRCTRASAAPARLATRVPTNRDPAIPASQAPRPTSLRASSPRRSGRWPGSWWALPSTSSQPTPFQPDMSAHTERIPDKNAEQGQKELFARETNQASGRANVRSQSLQM